MAKKKNQGGGGCGFPIFVGLVLIMVLSQIPQEAIDHAGSWILGGIILVFVFWFASSLFAAKDSVQNYNSKSETNLSTDNKPFVPTITPYEQIKFESAPSGDDDDGIDLSTASARLKSIREKEKEMIRAKRACSYPTTFTFNGDYKEGARVVGDWMKLMLRAFNGECDVIVSRVTILNIESSRNKIRKSADSINAIGRRMTISIREDYISLKMQELQLAFEAEQEKAAEKERLRQIREEEREKARVEKELQERRNKILKDQKHVAAEMASLTARISSASSEELETIQKRLTELTEYTQKLQEDMKNVELREQQARAGYVYIISNIGSFGENVYKIGMTRRLEPQDRVDELGDASVPFRFDVHAFIFSEDAVALETALHHAFETRRVNMVNARKEFFRVTLEEIEACVKANFSETVEFTRLAAAVEYRQTMAMLEQA